MGLRTERAQKGAKKIAPAIKPKKRLWKQIIKRYDLYLMLILPLAWYIIFQYGPMYGLQIAFKDYLPLNGFWGSRWVGFEYFHRFFSSYYFWRLIKNTVLIKLISLIFAFPIPILLALLVNEIKNNRYKKFLQNVTYIPHFISVVVIVGMLNLFLDPESGLINIILEHIGIHPVAFMEKASWFKPLFISSNIWTNMGWQSIIYIAALSGIDPQLYEAARVDGASRLRRIWHISIPGILPTIIILLILDIGHFMDIGFEKILLMQNDLNMASSDVIATFNYRTGILNGEYSYTTAIGLFDAIINFALLILINQIARKKTSTSLW
ncbi:putative aldouronate transport system permease protein [Pullulanibacillus pueri]|uniref:Sugar ABC transporter permease n=1 Tax=Pullulanibacillus pueri TaxID=1437324 RepID=A0A8J3ENY2_9BACL|nr:ABC transporter permease subunit [Pullulanibacillus pueri]MBM7683009.1 putative aldouronate transport system permease protein [Pullulanibacillus pueri]GGH85883.1 sugar ABC transporter permease [Pullulanibacillus pueri]